MPRPVLKAGSRPPWVGLSAAVWMLVAAGNTSTFALYSAALKSVLGFNQQQLTILGVAIDIGENVGLLPGYVCDMLPPWALLLVGALACFTGYGVLWLSVSQTVVGLPFWLLFLALVIATNSNAWFSTAIIITNLRNFPLSRGTVGGLLKGYLGISTAVYTVLYSMLLSRSPSNLLLLLTLGVPIICLSVMRWVRPCAPALGEDSSEHAHFIFVQVTSIVLAVFLLFATVLSEVVNVTGIFKYLLVAVMVFLLMSPLAVPIKMTLTRAKRQVPPSGSSDSLNQDKGDSDQNAPLLSPSLSESFLGTLFEGDDVNVSQLLLAEGEGAVKKKKPRRGEDFKLGEAFVKADYWLVWLVYFLGMGSGVTVTNNLAQIGFAYGVGDTTILLCLFSFCNFLGRLTSGAISEHFVRSSTLPRTLWMGLAQLIMALSFILFALSLNHTVYISTALIGLCAGFQYLVVPTVSELFGLKHFGIIYNFVLLANPVGASLFSALLASRVYDNEAAKQGTAVCVGPNCFRLTFLVLAAACGFGTLLSLVLTLRIRPVYQALYASGSFRISQASKA